MAFESEGVETYGAIESGVGQHAKSATAPGMSPAGGRTEAIGRKTDIAAGMSEAEGRPDVPQAWPELRLLAESCPTLMAARDRNPGSTSGLGYPD